LSTDPCDNQSRCKDACLPFYADCDYIFQDVIVTPAREGGTLVQWQLSSHIRDEGDYLFTLQVGNAGVSDPKAWKDVETKVDACHFIDRIRRLPGAYSFTHYRLKLETSEAVYFSRPIHTFGKLNYADYQQYKAIIRTEGIQLASNDGTRGTLLKRKISGRKCPRCIDFGTGEVKDGNCKFCYGTGWIGGYYEPIPCFYINLQPMGSTIKAEVEMQGQVADTQSVGRAIASPILISGDVWVSGESSERFRIMQLKHLVEMRGIPVVYQVGLERIPFSDVVYDFPLQWRNGHPGRSTKKMGGSGEVDRLTEDSDDQP